MGFCTEFVDGVRIVGSFFKKWGHAIIHPEETRLAAQLQNVETSARVVYDCKKNHVAIAAEKYRLLKEAGMPKEELLRRLVAELDQVKLESPPWEAVRAMSETLIQPVQKKSLPP